MKVHMLYNCNIQHFYTRHHTIKLQNFDAFHQILSLTHKLAVLLYGALVWCSYMVEWQKINNMLTC